MVKYVLLKQMNNIRISYYFDKDNPEVIYHVCGYNVVDVEDLLSGVYDEY